MTDPKILALPLPDAGARRRIHEDLDANLLVEAGAGSGKTTELVNRMGALVATGTATVDQIAAVTFTRKAAAELRERFQARLEERLRAEGDEAPEPDEHERLRTALEDIDRAFVGTIHAFCARLLRERPLEVGLDPGFEELPAEERAGFYRRFWESYLERLVRDGDPVLEELSDAGLRTGQLFGLFAHLVENPDVHFPAEALTPPAASEVAAVRRELAGPRGARPGADARPGAPNGVGLLPEEAAHRLVHAGRDGLEARRRTSSRRWRRCASPGHEPARHHVQPLARQGTRQGPGGPRQRLRLRRTRPPDASSTGGTPTATRWRSAWPRKAAAEFAEHRRRSGRLDFQDLLLLTARLLRERPGVPG